VQQAARVQNRGGACLSDSFTFKASTASSIPKGLRETGPTLQRGIRCLPPLSTQASMHESGPSESSRHSPLNNGALLHRRDRGNHQTSGLQSDPSGTKSRAEKDSEGVLPHRIIFSSLSRLVDLFMHRSAKNLREDSMYFSGKIEYYKVTPPPRPLFKVETFYIYSGGYEFKECDLPRRMPKDEQVVTDSCTCSPIIWWKPDKILSNKGYPILADKYRS
jgi:hypothetical protein